jgi:hypothetical protein
MQNKMLLGFSAPEVQTHIQSMMPQMMLQTTAYLEALALRTRTKLECPYQFMYREITTA